MSSSSPHPPPWLRSTGYVTLYIVHSVWESRRQRSYCVRVAALHPHSPTPRASTTMCAKAQTELDDDTLLMCLLVYCIRRHKVQLHHGSPLCRDEGILILRREGVVPCRSRMEQCMPSGQWSLPSCTLVERTRAFMASLSGYGMRFAFPASKNSETVPSSTCCQVLISSHAKDMYQALSMALSIYDGYPVKSLIGVAFFTSMHLIS